MKTSHLLKPSWLVGYEGHSLTSGCPSVLFRQRMKEGAMVFSRYEILWEVICDRHGWDYEDCPDDHKYEIDDDELEQLEDLWWEEGLD